MQMVNGNEIKVLGSFNHPVTEKEMVVVEYTNGIQTTVKGSSIQTVEIEDVKAVELVGVLKEEFVGLNPIIEGNAGEDLSVTFENELKSGKEEIITIYVNAGNYEVETNQDLNETVNVRKIVKLGTLVKWLKKRIG